jgi:hypothetical protein
MHEYAVDQKNQGEPGGALQDARQAANGLRRKRRNDAPIVTGAGFKEIESD